MSSTVNDWYNFVLQQMAAESYVDQASSIDGGYATVFKLGSNNPNQYKNPFTASETAILPGATRMTATQAADFLNRYTIVSHLPNTASGFSATLMRDNATGEYTLSMRSTEYFNGSQGGDWLRDGLPGADGEIGSAGFAFGQIASMESYYEHLKLGENFDAASGQWVSDANLNDFKNRFGATPTGGVLNVTGYSLSGQLADVFKTLHPEVAQGCAFNPTGLGNIGSGQTLATMVADFRGRIAAAGINLADPSSVNIYKPNPSNPLDPYSVPSPTVYEQIRNAIVTEYGTSYSQFGGDVITLNNFSQLYGHGANNDDEFVANAGDHVAATKIFIEDQPNIQGTGGLIPWIDSLTGTKADYFTTHSITLLADSLAVMSVFEKLGLDMSSSAGLTAAYNILAAGSNQLATGSLTSNGIAEGNSLEKAVEALGKLLLGEAGLATALNLNGNTDIPYGKAGGNFSNLTNRDKFYKVLGAVNAAANDSEWRKTA